MKDARFAASDAERNIERGFAEESDAQSAEEASRKGWELIAGRGPELIAKTAKDLEVASWLTEALLRRHQLAGLRDGLKLLDGLIERYWDGGWRREHRGYDETPEDHLWRAAAAVSEMQDALDELET